MQYKNPTDQALLIAAKKSLELLQHILTRFNIEPGTNPTYQELQSAVDNAVKEMDFLEKQETLEIHD